MTLTYSDFSKHFNALYFLFLLEMNLYKIKIAPQIIIKSGKYFFHAVFLLEKTPESILKKTY